MGTREPRNASGLCRVPTIRRSDDAPYIQRQRNSRTRKEQTTRRAGYQTSNHDTEKIQACCCGKIRRIARDIQLRRRFYLLSCLLGDQTMTNQQIRENFIEGKLTWADLLVITGLQANQLYEILSDLFDAYNQ